MGAHLRKSGRGGRGQHANLQCLRELQLQFPKAISCHVPHLVAGVFIPPYGMYFELSDRFKRSITLRRGTTQVKGREDSLNTSHLLLPLPLSELTEPPTLQLKPRQSVARCLPRHE